MSTCRLCHDWHITPSSGPMLKYSVRHYAHARCGCVRWGCEWLDKQPRWIIKQLPWFFVQDLMIQDYVRERLKQTTEYPALQRTA